MQYKSKTAFILMCALSTPAIAAKAPMSALNSIKDQLTLRANNCPKDKLVPIDSVVVRFGAELIKESRGLFKAEPTAKYIYYSGKSASGVVARGVLGPMEADFDEAITKRFMVGQMACDRSSAPPAPAPVFSAPAPAPNTLNNK